MQDELFEKAASLHKAGQVEEAIPLYQEVLEAQSDFATGHNYYGIALSDVGRLADAEAAFRRAIEIKHGYYGAHYNLGNMLYDQGRFDEAAAHYRRALESDPTSFDACFNLGNAYLKQAELDEAETSFRRALELEPDSARALSNLGRVLVFAGQRLEEAESCYRRALEIDDSVASDHYNLGWVLDMGGDLEGAEAAFRRALELDDQDDETYHRLGWLLQKRGRFDAAAEVFRAWLKRRPDNPAAEHMVAAWSGENVPPRAPDVYVRDVFDRGAGAYEAGVTAADCRGVTEVREALQFALGEPAGALDVLDAGCGTGLGGPLLRSHARTLTGVDLSTAMLDKARESKFYDRLVPEELGAFLAANPGSYDLIACVDTLIYFGELESVLGSACAALRPGGLLVLTTEKLVAGEPDERTEYRLNSTGRYSHTRGYLARVLNQAGMGDVLMKEVPIRKEAGQPVVGHVVIARESEPAT